MDYYKVIVLLDRNDRVIKKVPVNFIPSARDEILIDDSLYVVTKVFWDIDGKEVRIHAKNFL